MTLKFTGTIVGGPRDGDNFLYEGTCSEQPVKVLTKAVNLKLDGHIYKIVEFDAEKMQVVLMW